MIGKVVILFFLFYRNRSSLTTANSAESILNGIFNCSPKLLSEISVLQWPHGWPYVVLRRPGKCKTSNLRVIKTIRVRKEDLEPWILKSDIQARSERWVMTICKYLGGAPCPRSSGCCLVKSNKSLGRNLAAGWSSLPADDRRHGTCKHSAAWKVKIWVRSVNLLSQVHIGQIRGHGGSNGRDGQKSVCSPWPPLDRSDKVGSGIRIRKTNQPCNCKHTLI